eukprot:5701787-Pyramimonas_sp.AAC.1
MATIKLRNTRRSRQANCTRTDSVRYPFFLPPTPSSLSRSLSSTCHTYPPPLRRRRYGCQLPDHLRMCLALASPLLFLAAALSDSSLNSMRVNSTI